MATFSQQFLANLGRPAMTQGMFNLGAAIGGAPAAAKAAGKRKQLADIMQRGNAALAAGDANNIGRVRRELEEAGFAKEAAQMVQAEAQARRQQATSGMLISAVADPSKPLSPEVIQKRLGEGLTAQGLSSALQVRKALQPSPYFTRAEQIDLSEIYTPRSIAEATNQRNFGLLDFRDDVDDATVAAGITMWTDPTQPQAGTVLKTLQDNKGRTIEVGSRTQENPQGRIVPKQELEGLEKREKPPVQVTLSEQRESALAKSVGEDLAKEVSDQIRKAGDAMDMRSTIAEAQLIAQDQPDVFGSAAEVASGARKATLTLLRAMGVSDSDPLMEDFRSKERDVAQIRRFTMDFVEERFEATKGAISDTEVNLFIASVPNLLSTPGGYLKLLNQMESMNERTIMKGMALREARVADNPTKAINKIENNWDKFSSDFKYSTFMPPEEQRKLWNLYLEKNGKINKGEDVVFTLSAGGQPQASLTYNDLARRAARKQQSTEQYIYDLYYGNTGKTISLDLSGFDF
jgi:hypothetical protein